MYIATSLDGFIARPDGAIDWLPTDQSDGEDYGYKAFMDSVDTLVMGRNTFETVLRFGVWPYAGKRVVVLTNRPLEIADSFPGTISVLSGAAEDVTGALRDKGAQHVYLDGGLTIQGFLRAGVVDRVIVTRIPILIGMGIPLFGPLPGDVHLHHVETRSFPNGFVQSEYRIGPDLPGSGDDH